MPARVARRALVLNTMREQEHHHERGIRARVEGENPARRHAAPRRAARTVLQGRSPAAARETVRLGEVVGRRPARFTRRSIRTCSGPPRRQVANGARADRNAAREAGESRGTATTESEPSLEAALVAMDPTTGEVRAMVGGRDFKSSRFNRATQALAPAGFGVQALRVCRGARGRVFAVFAGHADSTSRFRRCRARGCRKTSTRTASAMTVRARCARRAIARPCACSRKWASRKPWRRRSEDGNGQRAERAVARARFGRSDADGDDVGLCRRLPMRDCCGRRYSFAEWRTPAEKCCSMRSRRPSRSSRRRPRFS